MRRSIFEVIRESKNTDPTPFDNQNKACNILAPQTELFKNSYNRNLSFSQFKGKYS